MCNVYSSSIIQLYNKFAGRGLFDLNIREYIKNSYVDNNINRTLDKNRKNFWFLNNGITIACERFEVDGDTVNLYNFSIVNGGQTTTLISKYKGKNKEDFCVPCKIVKTKKDNPLSFFTQIAESTNSQKPIYARDLRANAPEMIRLKRLLGENKIFLDVKRGVKPDSYYEYSISNDKLAQFILSFVLQRPGTARNGKKTIFENDELYDQVFKVNYLKDTNKKNFLCDVINLNKRFKEIVKKGDFTDQLTKIEKDILRNGQQVIFALMGLMYRLANNDITESDLRKTDKKKIESLLKDTPFIYSAFMSKDDDLDEKLKNMVRNIINIIVDFYSIDYDDGRTTSVSSYIRTDNNYYTVIIPKFTSRLPTALGKELQRSIDIFKRITA